ncbi:MAG: hypothetical protein AB7I13_18325 [Vicinamibacterales bacterium]
MLVTITIRQFILPLVAVMAALGWAPIGSGVSAQTHGSPERFRAFAVDMGEWGTTRSGTLDFVVTRWSTKAEQEAILGALDEGQDAFVRALERTRRVGYIQAPSSVGWDLHYADVVEGEDGGRVVTLLTDRPIGVWESVNRPRSIEYPVTWIQLKLDKDGRGEGTMFEAARVSGSLKHRFMVLENFATQGIRLMNVQSMSPAT